MFAEIAHGEISFALTPRAAEPHTAATLKTQMPPSHELPPPPPPPLPLIVPQQSGGAIPVADWRPGQPLPFKLRNCSAALFRHLAKTGGSTVQAVFRRNEQLGDFFYAAHGTWVEARPREWDILMTEIRADADAFIARHPRLLVSFHKQSAEQFSPRTVKFTDTNGRPRRRVCSW